MARKVSARGRWRLSEPRIGGESKFVFQLRIYFARIAPHARGDFGGEQGRNQAVLIGGPGRTVTAQEGSAGAFLAPKAERSTQQAVHKPFESDRDFEHLPPELGGHPID